MIEKVLAFWLGELDADGLAPAALAERWWRKDPDFDALIRARFGALHAAVAAGRHEDWLASPRGRLAQIIVLDQLSRNLFRDTARMFAWDERALTLAHDGLARHDPAQLATDERVFLYMPLMHSESLADQERCVALFESLAAGLTGHARARIDRNLDFARRHRDIVARFGRFPHRNALLARTSSEAEKAFLEQPGSSF